MANHTGTGSKDDPWVLKTPPGYLGCQMYLDDAGDPPAIICQVGGTPAQVRQARDRRPARDAQGTRRLDADGRHGRAEAGTGGDRRGLGARRKQSAQQMVSPGGGLRGQFGVYVHQLMEALGLAEITHDARNNKMLAL